MNDKGVEDFAGIAAAAAGLVVTNVTQLSDSVWTVLLKAPDGQTVIAAEVSHQRHVGLRAAIPVLPSLETFCEMFLL